MSWPTYSYFLHNIFYLLIFITSHHAFSPTSLISLPLAYIILLSSQSGFLYSYTQVHQFNLSSTAPSLPISIPFLHAFRPISFISLPLAYTILLSSQSHFLNSYTQVHQLNLTSSAPRHYLLNLDLFLPTYKLST